MMADRPPALSTEDLGALRPLAPPMQALHLLRGKAGPLAEAGVDFPSGTCEAAYLLWLVYRAATRPGGMLSGRPGYEAAETFASRVRSAAQRAGSLDGLAHELCRSLRVRPEKVLRGDDLVWWRQRIALDADGRVWRELRRRESLTEAITALGLLRDWMWELRATVPEEVEDAT